MEQLTYRQEYDKYLKSFDDLKKNMTSDSGDLISKSVVNLAGMNFRIGQIIADLLLEYAEVFGEGKKHDFTDKAAKESACLSINNSHKISLRHFESMRKDFDEMIKCLKKRLAIIIAEMAL